MPFIELDKSHFNRRDYPFKKGDEVIYTSGRHGKGRTNPLHKNYPDVIGVVVSIRNNGWMKVEWSNGTSNSYTPDDLELASKNSYQEGKEELNI